MSESEPLPRHPYSKQDYINSIWKVLEYGELYDNRLLTLVDDLAALLTKQRRDDAAYFSLDVVPLEEMYQKVVELVMQQTDGLLNELNHYSEAYGTVNVIVETGAGSHEAQVERLEAGDKIGTLHPIVNGLKLDRTQYTIPWTPPYENPA